MAAEEYAMKTQRKSFRGKIMYIWEGFDSQRHLSDTESKYDVLSSYVSRILFAEVLYRVPQKSLDTRSNTTEIPKNRQHF